MPEELPLYRDGKLYDVLFHGADDIPYWLNQLKPIEGACLELSCGTGRILLELAAQGVDVCGLDLSDGMLAQAADKAKSRGLQVELHQGDMRHFELDKTFAAIFVPNNALGHLDTRPDMENHLACVKQHLQPNGLYLIDMFVPNPVLLIPEAKEPHRIGQYMDEETGSVITIYESSTYDSATQMKRALWSHKRGEEWLREEVFSIRMYYPQELEALLIYNGFEIVAKYGDYDQSPFDSASKSQLIVARVVHH